QQYSSEQELQAAWDAHKRREQQAKSAHLTDKRKSVLDGVPVTMPALQRAEKLQRKAARVGFDWPAVSGALEKTREELEEVEEVLVQGNEAAIADELGDLLFAVVNVVRLSGMDAEQVLRGASRKFEQRFHGMEACLEKDDSINWEQLTLEEMESAWEKVKKMEKRD
ncbi:MAG: MazG nucleotide pyrophosphohydrolase domain-containing protein, partial [bacterium]